MPKNPTMPFFRKNNSPMTIYPNEHGASSVLGRKVCKSSGVSS